MTCLCTAYWSTISIVWDDFELIELEIWFENENLENKKKSLTCLVGHSSNVAQPASPLSLSLSSLVWSSAVLHPCQLLSPSCTSHFQHIERKSMFPSGLHLRAITWVQAVNMWAMFPRFVFLPVKHSRLLSLRSTYLWLVIGIVIVVIVILCNLILTYIWDVSGFVLRFGCDSIPMRGCFLGKKIIVLLHHYGQRWQFQIRNGSSLLKN